MNLNSSNKRKYDVGLNSTLKFLTNVKLAKFPAGLVFQEDSKKPEKLEIREQNAMELLNREPNKDTKDSNSELPLDGMAKIADKKKASQVEQSGSGLHGSGLQNDRVFGTKILNYGFEEESSSSSEDEDDQNNDVQSNLQDANKPNPIDNIDYETKKQSSYENMFNFL